MDSLRTAPLPRQIFVPPLATHAPRWRFLIFQNAQPLLLVLVALLDLSMGGRLQLTTRSDVRHRNILHLARHNERYAQLRCLPICKLVGLAAN